MFKLCAFPAFMGGVRVGAFQETANEPESAPQYQNQDLSQGTFQGSNSVESSEARPGSRRQRVDDSMPSGRPASCTLHMPCACRGSMGFVHAQCLMKFHFHANATGKALDYR